MKKLIILLVIFALIGCEKTEIKPTEQENQEITEKIFTKNVVYLVTYENIGVVTDQNYATNEQEIELLCESMLNYKETELIEINYLTGIIYYNVLNGNVWESVILNLYSFDSL